MLLNCINSEDDLQKVSSIWLETKIAFQTESSPRKTHHFLDFDILFILRCKAAKSNVD
jgi:hypothetical protein